MQIFKTLIAVALLCVFISPFIEQLSFIQDYLNVRKTRRVKSISPGRLNKGAKLLGFTCLPFLILALFSNGITRIIFIVVGVGYMIPIIMSAIIKKKAGLYSNGIIKINNIISFKDMSKVMTRKPDIIFLDRKDKATILNNNENEFMEIIEYIKENYKSIEIEEEGKIG
jgi:hypothetical protein